MVRKARGYFGKRKEAYYQATHRPIHCLVFLLPLIAWLLIATLFFQSSSPKIIAQKWIVEFVGLFVPGAAYLSEMILLIVLLVWQIGSGQRWRIRWPVIAGMAGESVAFCVPLLTMAQVLEHFGGGRALAEAVARLPSSDRLVGALTAGVYEELIFRLLLFWVLKILLIDVLELPRSGSTVAIVLVTGVLFSVYHYLRPGDFAWGTFLFRAAAGSYLGMIYVQRGFGITVGTHAMYDVAVTLLAA